MDSHFARSLLQTGQHSLTDTATAGSRANEHAFHFADASFQEAHRTATRWLAIKPGNHEKALTAFQFVQRHTVYVARRVTI
jgi:hypothetical protein